MDALRWVERHPLDACNTFRVPAIASLFAEVADRNALDELLDSDPARRGLFVLGEGSNLLFAGNPPGPVARIALRDMAILEQDSDGALVRADAGANWNAFVHWTLAQGLAGLENLALIPGTVGAAPIQNIGAYGTEVGEFIEAVEAFDTRWSSRYRLDKANCGFGYRDSVFKRQLDGWIVTAVEFRLPRRHALRMDYAGIREELAAMGVADPEAKDVAEAVSRLRRRKLPDPAQIGNAGSFFKNVQVDAEAATALKAEFTALPVYPGTDPSRRKLSAAWMIEACGWKGHREGDAGISAQHALVLVNHGHATGLQLLALARRVAASVRERFGVALEPEPRIIGTTW
jgi:UDP-N-acetylmuramate dehydrogenase